MKPNYSLEKIKFGIDEPTFERAVDIYETGGIKDFRDNEISGFSAKVKGSGGNIYDVFVSARYYDQGNCNCYLGQNDTLCKHMVAVAIYAIKKGKPLDDEEKGRLAQVVCSGKLGTLDKHELYKIKDFMSDAMRYIKPYNGPSRIWFSYQASLSEGCGRLAAIISGLPVSEQTAELLVNMLLKLDKKLSIGGVDDSDGTVGGFMQDIVNVLKEYAKLDLKCIETFKKLKDKETCFGWEEPLLELL